MYCKTCRQPLPHDARRCPNCGAPVENTVPQSGARDFTADYDPRDIQENRGWGILSYFGFLVLIPIFAASQLVFCAFSRKPGACAVSFLRVLFGADAHHHEHLKPRARLYTVCAGHDLRRTAIYRHHLLCADDPRHRKRRFRQSKGVAVHRPYSPFKITVHSKIALRDFLSQGILYVNFAKPLRTKSIYAILRKEKFSVRRILIKRQRGGAPDLPCRTAFT